MAGIRDDDREAFEASLEEERELLEAIAAVERGEIVRAEDLLTRLRPKPITGSPGGS